MPHVFISYVRENAKEIDRLVASLRAAGVEVWIDRESIRPGERWRTAITRAIREGACFIACFSKDSTTRGRTFMNDELAVAIDELRMRPHDRTWFIPVVLDGAAVPDRPIGGGETLEALQWVDLSSDWNAGVMKVVATVSAAADTAEPSLNDGGVATRHLLRVHQSTLGEASNPAPQPSEEERQRNAAFRIDVTYIEPLDPDIDDELAVHPGSLLARRLRAYGFNVGLAYWSEAYLLARLRPDEEDTAYVIHRDDTNLAEQLAAIVAAMDFVPRVVILTTTEASELSNDIAEAEMLKYVSAIVALRIAA